MHIVNIEELLFTFVKRLLLDRNERLCLGLTLYLEVLERTVNTILEAQLYDASSTVTAF